MTRADMTANWLPQTPKPEQARHLFIEQANKFPALQSNSRLKNGKVFFLESRLFLLLL
jgi:hypothetical protein